eukprot:2268836-Prymnesium_polylepis.1
MHPVPKHFLVQKVSRQRPADTTTPRRGPKRGRRCDRALAWIVARSSSSSLVAGRYCNSRQARRRE